MKELENKIKNIFNTCDKMAFVFPINNWDKPYVKNLYKKMGKYFSDGIAFIDLESDKYNPFTYKIYDKMKKLEESKIKIGLNILSNDQELSNKLIAYQIMSGKTCEIICFQSKFGLLYKICSNNNISADFNVNKTHVIYKNIFMWMYRYDVFYLCW